jgi:hypothetical protein
VVKALPKSTRARDRTYKLLLYRAKKTLDDIAFISQHIQHIEVISRLETDWKYQAYGAGEACFLRISLSPSRSLISTVGLRFRERLAAFFFSKHAIQRMTSLKISTHRAGRLSKTAFQRARNMLTNNGEHLQRIGRPQDALA